MNICDINIGESMRMITEGHGPWSKTAIGTNTLGLLGHAPCTWVIDGLWIAAYKWAEWFQPN